MKLLLLAALTALTLSTTSVTAQNTQCAPREALTERLWAGYQEIRQAVALGPNNFIVEVWANEETGTWTFTYTNPSGTTCILASGESYENLDEEPPKGDTH